MPCFDKKLNIVHVTHDKAYQNLPQGTTLRPPGTGAFSLLRDQTSQPSERIERPNTLWPSPLQYRTGSQDPTMKIQHETFHTLYEPPRPTQHPTTMNKIATPFTKRQNPGGVEDLHREIRESRLEQTIPPWVPDHEPLSYRRFGGNGSSSPRSQKPQAEYLPNNERRPAPARPNFSSQVRSPTSPMYGVGKYPPVSYTQPESRGVTTKKKRSNSFRDKFANGIDTLKAAGSHVKEVLTPRGKNWISPGRIDTDMSDESFACRGDPKDLADRNERETNAKAVAAFQAEKYHHKKDPPRSLRVETPTGPNVQPISPRSCAECRISLVKGMRTLCYPCEQRLKTPKHVSALNSTGSGYLPSDYFEQEERDPPISPVSPVSLNEPLDSQVRDFARPFRFPPPPMRTDYLTQGEVEIGPIPPPKDLKYTKYMNKPPTSARVQIELRVNTSAAERFEEDDVIFEPYRRQMTPNQLESFDLEMVVDNQWDSHYFGSDAEGKPPWSAELEKESCWQERRRDRTQRKTKFHEHLDD